MTKLLQIIFLFILSLLPIILLGYYIYYQDNEKEPKKLLLKLFLGGFISALLTAIISYVIRFVFPFFLDDIEKFSIPKLLIYTFVIVALVEEISKFIIVYLFSYNHKECDQFYDMVVYSVFVSLGFACIENLLYSYDGGISVAISRSLFAIPTHASVAVFMGYYLSLCKYNDINKSLKLKKKNLLFSIILPTLLHGTYDFLAYSSDHVLVFLFFIFTSLLIIHANMKLQDMANKNSYIISNNDNDLEVI